VGQSRYIRIGVFIRSGVGSDGPRHAVGRRHEPRDTVFENQTGLLLANDKIQLTVLAHGATIASLRWPMTMNR